MFEQFLEIAFEAELDTSEHPELMALAPELCGEHPATRAAAIQELRDMVYGTWDPNEYPVEDLVKTGMAIMEIGTRSPKMQILGGTCIVDLEGVTLKHAATLTPTIAYQIVCMMGLAHPCRLKSAHVVNNNWFLGTFVYLFKRFIDPKTWKRIHFHGHDLKSLQQHIDPECLPVRYGGTCRNHVTIATWLEKIRKYRDEKFDKEMKEIGYIIKE
ncbi:hypothetical protein MSG28_012490 [Choristoneura fumiferana]|uniref:Uncharacterized protein n=1 Tax=Choristoneura fumiferana TaxID=7141 RepID=A0ACC0KDB2_CHOFU|nr:hypothetical protein MSG28_012490 [Choristoneura fumiferana]